MQTIKASGPIGTARATLGEGPVWDGRRDALCWVDILGKCIHETGGNGSERRIDLPGEPGCAVLDERGDYLAAVEHGLLRVDRRSGACETVARLDDPDRLRFNDGKCDPAGRLWVGTMDREETEPLGTLYCFSSGEFAARQSGVTVSNGLGWSPCGTVMYYVDSPVRAIWRYRFDAGAGTVSERRTLASFSEADGFPDGMAVDAEGHLWVAFWLGSKVLRLHRETGEAMARIDLPASRVTSCAFGGAGNDRLYITTARVGLAEDEEALAGRLFVAEPGVPGAPVARFGA